MTDVEETLKKIKYLVCCEDKYELSNHTIEYIQKGDCTVEGIKHCIRNADTIHGIEEDQYKESVDNKIYTIKGQNHLGINFYTTGKFIKNQENQEIYFIVTAHTKEAK